jgi:hypothetical protein
MSSSEAQAPAETAKQSAKRRVLEKKFPVEFAKQGELVQKLLVLVTTEITSCTFERLNHVGVRQLAQVFDMLSVEEDPDKVLAWLLVECDKRSGVPPVMK